MSDPEKSVLESAIGKIDKKIEWREKRIKADREDVARLEVERESLAVRYREIVLAEMKADGPRPQLPGGWGDDSMDEGKDPWA